MSVLDRMRARLADPASDKGSPCRWCGTTALECQVIHVTSGEREWCCAPCRVSGARIGHKV